MPTNRSDRRRWIPARLLAAAAAWLLAAAPAAAGPLDQHVGDRARDAESTDRLVPTVEAPVVGGEVNAVPVPVLDPTLGVGIAPTLLYTFSADPSHPKTPRSTLAAVGAYTSTDSWLVGAGLKLYLDEDRWRFGAKGGYGSFNLEFYGFGGSNSFLRENPLDFQVEGYFAEAELQARVLPSFYLGGKVRWLDPVATFEAPVSFLPPATLNAQLFGLGPTFEFDDRDSTWYPETGALGRLEVLFYEGSFIGDLGFSTADAAYARYWMLTEGLVLAGQLRVAHAGDDAPFFMLPFVSLRGFPAGFFLNEAVAQAQAELRWRPFERVGFVGFGGFGGAADTFADLADGPVAVAGGVGVRYLLSKADRMNIGFDVATGTDAGLAFYFRIGEAF